LRVGRYRGKHLKRRPKRKGPLVIATAASISVAGPAGAATHTVRRGQTLSEIAGKYRTSVSRLVKMNDLSDPDLIVAGQRLRVPGGSGGGGSSVHVVRSGETLSEIAARHGTSVDRLARRNGIKNPGLIRVGQRIRVPAGGGGSHHRPRGRAGSPASPGKGQIKRMLVRHATSHGVSVPLVKAVAWQESGWQQDVRSSAGAVGVMQVMPGTARFVNEVLDHGNLNLYKADHNVHLGVAYLRHMLQTMRSTRRALAAYYSGPGNVGKRLRGYQKSYVRSVLALRNRFR
jgi:N-acetylmuramoyl-L-alanine amidase